jgi:hypothetical protein
MMTSLNNRIAMSRHNKWDIHNNNLYLHNTSLHRNNTSSNSNSTGINNIHSTSISRRNKVSRMGMEVEGCRTIKEQV